MPLVRAEQHELPLLERVAAAVDDAVQAAPIHVGQLVHRVRLALEQEAALFLVVEQRVNFAQPQAVTDFEIVRGGQRLRPLERGGLRTGQPDGALLLIRHEGKFHPGCEADRLIQIEKCGSLRVTDGQHGHALLKVQVQRLRAALKVRFSGGVAADRLGPVLPLREAAVGQAVAQNAAVAGKGLPVQIFNQGGVSFSFRFPSGKQAVGILSLRVQGGNGGLHVGKILAVGHAVPRLVGVQHAHAAQALLNLQVRDRGKEKFAFQGIIRQIFPQENREAALQLVKNARREAPEVHRHHRVAGKRRPVLAVVGVGRVVAALFDARALGHAGEQPVFRFADAACHRAVGGHGVAQAVADHGVLIVRVRLAKEVGQRGIGAAAVKIVGIDRGEIARDLVLCAQDRVARAPRLLPPLRHGEACGQAVVLLIDVDHLDVPLDGPQQTAEILVDGMLDNKDHLAEAGGDRIVDGIVKNAVALGVDGANLLESAEPAAHTRCHDDQRGFVHESTSFRNVSRYYSRSKNKLQQFQIFLCKNVDTAAKNG